jgi:hypothetical protein
MRRIPATALQRVERELVVLDRRRSDLDKAIARLRRIAVWLRQRRLTRASTQHDESAGPGLTDACRAVLRMSPPAGVTPREARQLLTHAGVSWDRFVNPMSAVHTVLKRLVKQNDAVASIAPDGQRRYAARRSPAVGLTRRDADDSAFMRKLIQAESPEAIADLLKHRRAEWP